jgi:nucleoside-diphosphate-sugar epimerase
VYTSTLAVNSDTNGHVVDESYKFQGTHISVYDRTKAEAHELVRQFAAQGGPFVIVQPGLVYGPGDTSSVRTMFRQFLKRTLPLIPTKTAFSWGHIDDIVVGHLLAMERGQPGRNYFLAGPAHTFEEAIAVASQLTGIPGPKLRASPGFLRGAARMAGLLERLVRLPPEYTAEGLRVLAGTTYLGSSARAQTELGWRARPLHDGLRATLRHEMAELGMPAMR